MADQHTLAEYPMYAPQARSSAMDPDVPQWNFLAAYDSRDGHADAPSGNESFDYDAASASSSRWSQARSSGSNWPVSTPGSQDTSFPGVASDTLLEATTRSSSAQISAHEGLDPGSWTTIRSARASLDSDSRPSATALQEPTHSRLHVCPYESCPRHIRGFSRRGNLNDHVRRRHRARPAAGAEPAQQPYPASDTDVHLPTAPLEYPPVAAFLSSSNLRHHNSAFNGIPAAVRRPNGRVYGSIMLLCSLWHSFYSDFQPSRLTQQQLYEVFGIKDTESIQLARNIFEQLYSNPSPTVSERLPPSIEIHFLDTLLHVWRQINPREVLSEEKARLICLLLRWPMDADAILLRVPRLLDTTTGMTDLQRLVLQTQERFRNNQEACSNIQSSTRPTREGLEGPFKCTNECGTRFLRRNSWLRHEEANWRQRFWFCWKIGCCRSDPSGRVFLSEQEYRSHLQAQHDESPLQQSDIDQAQVLVDSNFPRQCNIDGCEARFLTWDERNQHLEEVHFVQPSNAGPTLSQNGRNGDNNPDGGSGGGGGGFWTPFGNPGILFTGPFCTGGPDSTSQYPSGDYGGSTGWRVLQGSAEPGKPACKDLISRSKSDACIRTKMVQDSRLKKQRSSCLESSASSKPLTCESKSPQLRSLFFQVTGQVNFDPTAFLAQDIFNVTLR